MKKLLLSLLSITTAGCIKAQIPTPLTPVVPVCNNIHGTLGAPYVLMVIPQSSSDPAISQQIVCVQIEGTSLAVAKTVFPDGTTGWVLRAITTTLAFPEIISSEILTGTNDGTNNTFTIQFSPVASSLSIYINGMRQTEGVDFTMSNPTTIVFNRNPPTQSILRATYWK